MKNNILRRALLGLLLTMVSSVSAWADTFTSTAAGGRFSSPSTWGSSMTAAEMLEAIQAKTNTFVVQAGATVTVDDSVNVYDLTVNGTLVFGDVDNASYTVIVNNKFTVTGVAEVSDHPGAHTLLVRKGFTSTSGKISFREGTGQAVNVVFGAESADKQTVAVNTAVGQTKFGNFDVANGEVTAGSDLTIAGAFTIGSSGKFIAGDKTIYVAGNFSKKHNKKASFDRGTSTFVFNGNTVQSISNAGELYFNRVIVNGRGFVVVSNGTRFYGDFLIENNSSVSTSAAMLFYGRFEVQSGSKYESNADYTQFNADADQDIIMDGDVSFAGIYCSSTKADSTTKTFKGSINSTQYIRAMGTSRIVDDASAYHHTFVGATAEGRIALSSPMTIRGGTLRKSEAKDPVVYGTFSLGTGDITIQSGDVYVRSGDTFKCSSNITVETGSLVMSGDTDKQSTLIGNGSNTLTVASGAKLYIRGANDNFPQNITVNLNDGSTTYYDSKFNQQVHGAHYGTLVLDYYDKTFTGNSYIAGHLYMRPMTKGESTVDFGKYSHTLCYHFYDDPDRKGTTSLVSGGTITLKSTGNHGQTIYKRTTGTYTFKNLIIENDDPAYAQTKTIGGDIHVNGRLELSNSSTNEILLLTLNMGAYGIEGDGSEGNDLVMGPNTCIKTSGENNFATLTESFRDVRLDRQSIIQFESTKVNQVIPTVEYGNVYIYGSTAKTIGMNTTIKGWINQNGGTPKLTITDAVTVTIQGDWKLGSSYLDITPEATINFDGDNQEIVGTTLPNVHIGGSGVKTLKGTLTIAGDLWVHSGSEFDADTRTINLYGNFNNTDGGGGRFHQIGGRLNLRGDNYDQTVACTSVENTVFYDVYVEKKKTDKVVFKSDVYVGRNMMTSENKGGIDIENHTLTVGGDFCLYRNCPFFHADGAKLNFNGSDAEQKISNLNTENIYPEMMFSGTAVKRLTDNPFDINGDITICGGAIVSSGVKLKVSGNWTNAGTFNSSSEVVFDGEMGDGEFQLIGGSAFNNVTFGGKGEKRLGGIINLTGWLKIDSLARLDVSPDEGNTSYGITLASHWYNNIVSPDGTKTGYFEPRQGTVTFVGNSTYIYSGDSLRADGEGEPGKKFYNVVINTSDPANYKGLYPIHGADAKTMTKENDLYVINDFTINTGIFYFYWNKMFVGGNLRNIGGTLSMNGHYDARNKLFLGGRGNNLEFDPGTANTIRQIEIINGGTYHLTNSYLQYSTSSAVPRDSVIRITNGTLWMKNSDITFYESGGIIIEENGALHLDSAAVIQMPSNRAIRSHGRLELKGNPSSPAKIQSASADGYYYIVQEHGTFSAEDFCIEGTRGRGLEIRGGTVTKLQNGSFSNSGYTWNSTDRAFYGVSVNEKTFLLTLDGITLGAAGGGLTADNITFNVKNSLPAKNVHRESGTGAITFTNYGGTMAGKAYEVDQIQEGTGEGQGTGLIVWEEPKGCVWTGEGGDNRWHNRANWKYNEVPTRDSVVILNKSVLASNYTILVDQRAEVKDLTIADGVTLLLDGEKNVANPDGLEVFGKLTMMSGSTLTQTNRVCDSLILHGSWTCSGTYNHNSAPVVFDMAVGSYQLTMNSGAKIGALVVRSKADGALTLMGEIKVADSVRYESGTLYGSNAKILLEGDWIPAGGVFEEGESVVDFCKADGDQFVNGGRFWIIKFEKGGNKTLNKDITVNRTFQIENTSGRISAGFRNIYMAGRTTYWYNYSTNNEVFVQTGDGAVIFTGGSASIGNVNSKDVKTTQPTVFNNIYFQGTSTKYIRDTTFVTGAVEMVANIDVSINKHGAFIGKPGSSFTAYGGSLLVYGKDNFPKDFGSVNLNAGSVYYRDSCEYQIVRNVEYNNLYLYNYYFTTYGYKDYSPKYLEGDIIVKGTITINDSITTLYTNGHQITLTGNLSLAENGKQIDWGTTGTIVHVGGTWSVDADISTLNNVYKKGTGYLTMNNNLTVNGDIEFDPETQLRMGSYTMTGKPGKSFKMGVNCQLHTSVVKGDGDNVALPTGFGTFELDSTSYTYLEAAADQILPSNVTYGIVYLNNTASRTVYLNGDTYVKGNFYNNQDGTVLDDQDLHNLHLYGATNDLRNYRPTATTVFFEREGDQRVYAGGSFTDLYLNNVVLNGSGVKEIDETNNRIGGDITVGSKASFSCDNVIVFSGDAITNNGVFRHYGNTFTFTGAKTHTVRMGDDNIFNSFAVTDDDAVSIADYGITVNTGAFSLGKRATVDMGGHTHKIASAQIELGTDCNWITENANFIFNRGGSQTLPALKCRNIRFSTSGTKTLAGRLEADTLTIDEGVTLSVGSDASKSNSITLYGDWICNGSFTSHNDTVFFESKVMCGERKIKSNEQWFSDLVFHRNTELGKDEKTIFKLQDKVQLKNNMEIDTGAVVCLNKNTLVIGNDDSNITDPPYYPDGEKITVLKGGELNIDAGGTLQFDHYDGYPHLDVYGKLTMVGSEQANAVITRSTSKHDTHGTMVTIHDEAKLAAKYYQVQYLAPTGFVIQNGAEIDDVNNLSFGIWSNMYTSYNYKNPFQADDNVLIDTLIYLTINVDRMENSIENLAFNHGGTPTIGHHFNIMRDPSLPESIELSGTINGAMGFIDFQRYHYIDDNPANATVERNIIWPPVKQAIWTGLVSQDWFDRRNWFPMTVPDEHLSVKIPMTSNAPIIYRPGAECENLTITNGSLTIEDAAKSADGIALRVGGSVDVQNGGVFAVENTAGVWVKGDWSIAQKGYFVPQNGTVFFAATGGSVSISPRKSDFNNVSFVGGATYMFMNSQININGDFTVNSGLVWPATADYSYSIGGNYFIDAERGGYNKDVVGFVNFVGGDQTIQNGQFNRVRFTNTGNKIIIDTLCATYNNSTRTARTVIVDGTAVLKASAGCKFCIKGNILIDSNAAFDDGGQTHTFTGYYWEGAGGYMGTGKILFNANHAQYIWGGKFHDIDMTLNTKSINGDVTMNGNLSLESCTLDMLTNHINGAGAFTMGEKSNVYARGANNYPSFSRYNITGASCYSYYNGPMDQTIRMAKYGYLYLNSNTTKTLEGDITVLKDLYIYENGGTLCANDKNIYVGQHWKNQNSGRFEPGTGRVIFNGSAGNQYVYLGVLTENPFYEIEIDKPATQQFYASSVDLTLGGSLYVTSGKMNCVSGYRVRIGGNVTVGSSGLITQSGHYELYHNAGESTIQTNGSILNDLTLNGNCNFKLSDDITVYGNFTLQKGTFDQNHHVATLGNSLDNIAIYGTYKVTAGGKLRIGDGTSLVVKAGGVFEALGTASSYAQITNNSGRYYFTVEADGRIKADNYNFSYLAKQGIIISDGAIIDGEKNFSNGVFSNVVSGGVCLDIRNSQTMKGTDLEGRIRNISFPNNPGGGAVNIRKVESSDGEIEVYNATGLLAGELYENDPHNIITWTGDVEYTWTGRVSNDWWDAGNWIAKLNGELCASTIPTADNNVIIPSTSAGSGRYPVITHDSAFAKRITIENTAQLTINVADDEPDPIRCALYATSDVTINGTLIMTSAIDTLNVRGNWVIGRSGKFTAGEGTVEMAGVGVKTIQNGSLSFYNLVIDNNGTMQAQSVMNVGGNFIIKQGVFDVTSYDVSVGGSYINSGTFMPQTKTLFLTGTASLPGEGYHTFNPGSNAYYNVTVRGGAYALKDNELFVSRNLAIDGGALTVNSNVVNLGDGTGVDNLNITGTLRLQNDGKIKMGNNAIINVNSAGTISLLGDVNHEAIVTSQSVSGTYTFNVYGCIAAKYYKIERVNNSGVHLYADATIDNTNNLSHGQYVSGTAGGRYLWFENNFGAANTDTVKIQNVYFNAGPRYNASRDDDATNGVIAFVDAVGVAASYYYEEDDGIPNTGAVVWKYTGTVLQWVGGHSMVIDGVDVDVDGTRWDNPDNWKNLSTNDKGLPSKSTELHIYPVAGGKYPIIFSDDRTIDDKGYVVAKGITLYEGASLTQKENRRLKVEDVKSGLIIGKNATFTAYDSVFIKGQFSNAGRFDNGGKSTIVWQSSLNRNIEMNNCPFYNFMVKNEGGATVTFSVEQGKSLVVENDFTIESGTVNCNGGTLMVGGDFVNKAGNFVHGNGTVIMNGALSQKMESENGRISFYNLELVEAGKKEIHTSIDVAKTIIVGTAVQAMDGVDIICKGDWKRPQSSEVSNNFIGGSGYVRFTGTSLQTIGKPESFTNVEINNTSSTAAVSTTYTQTIANDLKLTKGIFTTSNPVHLEVDAGISAFSNQSYINGAVRKVKASAVDSVFFPIGGNDRYAPIAIGGVMSYPGTYQVAYHSETPSHRDNLHEGLNRVSSSEYWTLDCADGTKLPRVTISWMDRNFSGLKDFDVLSVALYSNNEWTRQGEINKLLDLHTFAPGDSTSGMLTSRNYLTADGNITFGFSYPTLKWKAAAETNVYATKTNWSPNTYKVDDGVNILVETSAGNYPTVLSDGECYDMTIGVDGKLKVAANAKMTVWGNAVINGTLELEEGAQIIFMKDVDGANATVIAAENSSVVIGGVDTDQEWSLSSCHNLVVSNADGTRTATKRLTSDITVEGSISIMSRSALVADGKSISLMGDFNINSAGDYRGSITLILCGTEKQKLAITPNKPLHNLTINNTYVSEGESGVDLGTGIVVNGKLKFEKGILRSKSTARLCLSSTSTTEGANAESYVIGEMEKKGKGDFTFPIGSERGLAQIGVSVLSSECAMYAEYVTGMPPMVRSLEDGKVEKVSWLESWHLGSNNLTNAFVTLYWNDAEFSDINDPDELLVAAYVDGEWKNFGKGSVVKLSEQSGHIKSSSKVQISGSYQTPRASARQSVRRSLNSSVPHTLAGGNGLVVTFGTMSPEINPLPIELYSFDAVVTPNNDVRLDWSTASEHNNAYFTIEHMFEGETEIIDTVAAQGGAGEGASYSYLHINQPVGTHYYRLHQTDYDGVSTVASDWVAVVIENADQPVLAASVVPNPGRCQNIKVLVSGISDGKFRYVVADMSGQALIDRTVNTAGATSYQIDASDWNLQSSVYLIKIFTDNGQTVSKFVVE